jgi:tetratricopeptide (TPR) repeat protein
MVVCIALVMLTGVWAASLVTPRAASRDDLAEAAALEGKQALRTRDYEAAANAFERALELRPDDLGDLLDLGRARAALLQWPEAIAAYARLIELDPRNAKALHNLANVHLRQGDYAEAALWYAKALDADPDYLLATYNYGRALTQLSRSEEAEETFNRCLELEARSDRDRRTQLDCLFFLGTLRFRAGDYEQSASVMERVVSIFGGHAEARYYLGMSYRRLGRSDEAVQQLAIHKELLKQKRPDATIEKRQDP